MSTDGLMCETQWPNCQCTGLLIEQSGLSALLGVTVLYIWARRLTLTVPLSIQVYKMGTGEFNALTAWTN